MLEFGPEIGRVIQGASLGSLFGQLLESSSIMPVPPFLISLFFSTPSFSSMGWRKGNGDRREGER